MVTSHASECEEGVEEGEQVGLQVRLAKPNQMAAGSERRQVPPFQTSKFGCCRSGLHVVKAPFVCNLLI